MFDQEFYPTPKSVLDVMDIDCYDKVVLEPSAGKGDIAKYCKSKGAREVLACEKVAELMTILSKHATIINDDFFNVKSENISHVDLIVMNPPFSNADKHILHAWEIAPEGVEIIALCNWETINNSYSRSRWQLNNIINNYGESMNLGRVFNDAERNTNVEIGLIRLFKPKISGNDLDDFYYDLDNDIDHNGVIRYNEIRAVVNIYLSAVKCFDEVEAISDKLYKSTNVELFDNNGNKHKLSFGNRLSFTAGYNESFTTKKEFSKAFQMECWNYIFDRVNIQKYITKGVMEDINKFINSRKNYPFTMKNITKMLDIIIGTRDNIMNRAIEEAVDNFTKHTHENRFRVEGWKTNSGYLLNKKFIINNFANISYRKLQIKDYYYPYEKFIDLIKALSYILGKDYSKLKSIQSASALKNEEGQFITSDGKITNEVYKAHKYNDFEPNKWYDWEFFEFKVFKKGTAHFKFKDLNDWATLNRAYAKIKGQVLPEKI